MLASSVVRVHLAAAVPCSRARRPLQAARADVYAAALANACRTWKLRSAREPTGLRPLGMPVSDRSGCPCIGYVACIRGGEAPR
jgi:hypothetical protein